MAKITGATIRMYRMGTGDCFIVKFLAGKQEQFTMMIDCGTWSGAKDHIVPYITDLKTFVGNSIDLLVVTHEHKDHVYVFELCKELFTEDFEVHKVWMAWTENERLPKAKQWQKEFGDKKRALALVTNKLKASAIARDGDEPGHESNNFHYAATLNARAAFSSGVDSFNILQSDLAADGTYVGGLKGMNIVKNEIGKTKIEYFHPGDIVDELEGLTGVRFYILGPPESWDDTRKESGGKGESFDHNSVGDTNAAFTAALLSASDNGALSEISPFASRYVSNGTESPTRNAYESPSDDWRRIDHDWLRTAGELALRINSVTNNLSLALAIEFKESGRVMLFPGDAEYGSWSSWHKIDWSAPSRNEKKHLTEDLLNRTVFYKVAHHLSHNGTAKRLGVDMMIHPDLVAMATLDYDVISKQWMGTMPSKGLLTALLDKTKGRLLIMNEAGLKYDSTISLTDKIKSARKKMSVAERKAFEDAITKTNEDDPLYIEFRVRG